MLTPAAKTWHGRESGRARAAAARAVRARRPPAAPRRLALRGRRCGGRGGGLALRGRGRRRGFGAAALLRCRRIEVRVPAASLEDEVTAADLPLGRGLATLRTNLEGVLGDLLDLLPFIAAVGADVLVRGHGDC